MSKVANLEDNTFSFLCRLCAMKSTMSGVDIFSNEGTLREIRKKIKICLRFTVDQTDTLPKFVCFDCVCKLDLSYEFLLKCLESQQFLSEFLQHEAFDTIYVYKDDPQQYQLCMELNALPGNCQSDIHDLQNLVDEAHINHHTDSNDITQIIQYHDGELNDEQIQAMDSITNLPKDTDSLPDIALYSFDTMDNAKDNDYLDDANFNQNSNSSMLENVFNKTSLEVIEQPAKETLTIPNSKACTVCNKTFSTNYKLTEHMRKHESAPFKCQAENCGKTFRSKIGLTQHEANHTGIFKFSCEICGKGFQIKSYLTIHKKIHSNLKPYSCSICGLKVKAKQALVDHENRHFGVKNYQCSQCDRKFISKAICTTHEKTQHSNESNHKHPCPVCKKLFVRKSYLKTHMTIHEGKLFICDVCGKKFLTNLDLKLHSTTHSGQKSYVCEVCGKAFARPDAFGIHKRSHTGHRPYKCQFCGQQFTQVTSMKLHVRLHTAAEKPYKCSLCSLGFVSKTYLNTHKKKHSKMTSQDGKQL